MNLHLKFFFLFSVLFCLRLAAQTDFRDAYIIKNEGDTIYGKVDFRGDALMAEVCRFKMGDDELIFSPYDIQAFRFIDSKYYISKEIDGRKYFLEYLINGKISIYFMQNEIGPHYFISKNEGELTELIYNSEIVVEGGKTLMKESIKHQGILNYYMSDASNFSSKIQKIGKPEHRELIRLAEDYHFAVCDDKCIVYEKQKRKFHMNLEVLGGPVMMKSLNKYEDNYQSGTYFQYGALAYFWMPNFNQNLYIKTGFIYSSMEKMGGGDTIRLTLPFQLAYLAPNSWKVRPNLSLGLFAPTYNAGVMVKMTDRINLGLQGWFEFVPKEKRFLVPSEFWNYSLMANVHISLHK
jgi:hypothetical protein